MSWRPRLETVLQLVPIGAKTFRSTSNKRNEQMFKEATDFAVSIRTLDKDMKQLLKTIDAHFKNLRCILVSPLPRVWTWSPNGDIQPLDAQQQQLGGIMEAEGIPIAAAEARSRINKEVLEPLNEWLKVYRQLETYMKSLEVNRLTLDSRRRTVDNLQGKIERLRSVQGTSGQKGATELEETTNVMSHKDGKLARANHDYIEEENRLYNSLYTLVKDTRVLRDYTHCCLTIMQGAFESAAKAYDAVPASQGSISGNEPNPLPNETPRHREETSKYEAKSGLSKMFARFLPGKGGKSSNSPYKDDGAGFDRDQANPGYSKSQSARYPAYNAPSSRHTTDSELPNTNSGFMGSPYAPQPQYQQPQNGYGNTTQVYQAQATGEKQYPPPPVGHHSTRPRLLVGSSMHLRPQGDSSMQPRPQGEGSMQPSSLSTRRGASSMQPRNRHSSTSGIRAARTGMNRATSRRTRPSSTNSSRTLPRSLLSTPREAMGTRLLLNMAHETLCSKTSSPPRSLLCTPSDCLRLGCWRLASQPLQASPTRHTAVAVGVQSQWGNSRRGVV